MVGEYEPRTKSTTGETQERHEKCELSPLDNWYTVESGIKHHSINQSLNPLFRTLSPLIYTNLSRFNDQFLI